MSKRKEKYDIEAQNIMTLSQKLVSKSEYAYFRDFAMNLNADKIAIIDLLLETYKKYPKVKEFLTNLRKQLMRVGEALYIMESDVLTNLGLKVGKTGVVEISGKSTSDSME